MYITYYTSHLFLLPYFLFYNHHFTFFLFINYTLSIYFWDNPIQHSFIHKIDSIFAKLSILYYPYV